MAMCHVFVPLVNTEQIIRFSWNFIYIFWSWRPFHICAFYTPTANNVKMAVMWISKAGAALQSDRNISYENTTHWLTQRSFSRSTGRSATEENAHMKWNPKAWHESAFGPSKPDECGSQPLSVTADHYMGGLRRRGSTRYHNIPLSSKDHAVSLYYQNRKATVFKLAMNYFLLSANLQLFLNNTSLQFLT